MALDFEEIRERLTGRYERTTLELIEGNNPVLYVNFNDSYDNTLSILASNSRPLICNFKHLTSETHKPVYEWSMEGDSEDTGSVIELFDKCYNRVLNDAKGFEQKSKRVLEENGLEHLVLGIPGDGTVILPGERKK